MGAVTATCMGQDAQGFLWIGTQTGLYRYDGARARKMIEVESITGHYIVDMLIASDGTPWFAGNRGIAHLENGEFKRLAISPAMMPLGTGNQILAVDSQGVAFVLLFKGGVLRIDPKNPASSNVFGKAENIQENAAGIVRAPDDTIWITFGTHLAHLDPGGNTFVVDPEIRLPKDRVVALLFDGSETMWLRTATHLASLDPRMHKITLETGVSASSNEEEGKPSIDQQGRLLVPTSAGLYWKQEGRWQVLTDRQGITSNDVECALEDREGTLWIAGSGTGLDRLPGVREWSADHRRGIARQFHVVNNPRSQREIVGQHWKRNRSLGPSLSSLGQSHAGEWPARDPADSAGRRRSGLGCDADRSSGAD